jgi:predicted AAA+ superfamily ATPase
MEWQTHRHICAFPLGTHDLPDRLLIPERLYGREREVNILLGAYDRMVTHGNTELVLVSGYSGIGKSSVVKAALVAAGESAAQLPRGNGERVLLVEDEVSLLALAAGCWRGG